MTVAIATSNNRSERLRALSAKHPYMTTLDIAKLTGNRIAWSSSPSAAASSRNAASRRGGR